MEECFEIWCRLPSLFGFHQNSWAVIYRASPRSECMCVVVRVGIGRGRGRRCFFAGRLEWCHIYFPLDGVFAGAPSWNETRTWNPVASLDKHPFPCLEWRPWSPGGEFPRHNTLKGPLNWLKQFWYYFFIEYIADTQKSPKKSRKISSLLLLHFLKITQWLSNGGRVVGAFISRLVPQILSLRTPNAYHLVSDFLSRGSWI